MNTTATELQSVLNDHLAKLVACGNTEALALHLQAQQIKAMCGNPNQCALAVSFERALKEAFPDAGLNVTVGLVSVIVDDDDRCAGTETFPRWMSKFINNFDEGKYPELMAKNATNWDNDLEMGE